MAGHSTPKTEKVVHEEQKTTRLRACARHCAVSARFTTRPREKYLYSVYVIAFFAARRRRIALTRTCAARRARTILQNRIILGLSYFLGSRPHPSTQSYRTNSRRKHPIYGEVSYADAMMYARSPDAMERTAAPERASQDAQPCIGYVYGESRRRRRRRARVSSCRARLCAGFNPDSTVLPAINMCPTGSKLAFGEPRLKPLLPIRKVTKM